MNTTGGDYVGMVEQGFDVRNNVSRLTTEFGGLTHTQQYFYETNTLNANSASYSKDNLPSAYKFSSNRYATYDYDSLNRLNKRTFTLNGRNLYNNYVYWLSDRNAEGSQLYRTTQLKTELVDNTAYTYTYDKVGNITEVKKGTRTNANTDNIASGSYSAYRSYVYDDLGQLTRENNATAGETHVFTYDSRGNRGTDTTYAYTTASSVANPVSQIKCVYGEDADAGWKKLVTSVDHYVWNSEGKKELKKSEAMDYDEIGNPIVYRDADLLWNGRQLTSYEKEANEDEDEEAISLSYLYDADGLRTQKTTGDGVVTKFWYSGSKLAYQEDSAGNKLYFFYDASGNLSVIRQVTPTKDYHFYVTTNAQGDVLGIYSSTGILLASYEYDAWGNCTVSYDNPTYNIGTTNPIRYRGYYYDSETELYYLQSRYYDSEIGRFLNADGYITTGQGVLSYNMFAYCLNNPIMNGDPSGKNPIKIIILGLSILSMVFLGLSINEALKTSSKAQVKSSRYGKASAVTGAISTVLTVVDESSTVVKNKTTYAKDVVNSDQLEDGELYESPNERIFGSDEEYTKKCIEIRKSALLESGILYENVTWNELVSTGESEAVIGAMASWDFSTCFSLGLSSAATIVKSLCGVPF